MNKRSDPGTQVVKEYRQLAAHYDRRWTKYIEATVRETVRRTECRADERILDIGCGTGVLLQQLAARTPGASFTGVDLVPEMLKLARKRTSTTTLLAASKAEALPLDRAAFDLVVSTSALHFFNDTARALAEMKRVLRPGGRLVLTDWCGDYASCRILDRGLRLVNRAHGRVYKTEELRHQLTNTGFENIAIDRYRIDWFWGMMTARAIAGPS